MFARLFTKWRRKPSPCRPPSWAKIGFVPEGAIIRRNDTGELFACPGRVASLLWEAVAYDALGKGDLFTPLDAMDQIGFVRR